MGSSYPAWAPLSGQKRKAFVARLGEDFDPGCGPAPPKLWAVDHEAADAILDDENKYDPSHPPPPAPVGGQKEAALPMEDDEMGDCAMGGPSYAGASPVFPKEPGETIHKCGVNQCHDLDGKECRQFVTHSMHESQPKAPPRKHDDDDDDSEALTKCKKDVTLVLSHEIQESLTLRKLSDGYLLPKLMSSQQALNNSMMLVEWKPKPTNPIDYFLKIKQTDPSGNDEKIMDNIIDHKSFDSSNSSKVGQSSQKMLSPSPLSTQPLHSNSGVSGVASDDDNDELDSRMDIDIVM